MASNNPIKPLQRFIDLLRPEKDLVFLIYIYAIFAGLISLTLPLGIQAIINFIMGGAVSTSWIFLVALVILGIIATGILQIKQLTITEILQQKIFSKASFEFAYKIPRFKIDKVRDMYLPELINRFFDTMSVQKGLSKVLIDFSTNVLQIIFGLILLSFYHPFFIAFSLLLVVLIFLLIRFTGPKGLSTSLKESHHKYETAHWLEELALHVETFKMAGNSELPLRVNDDHTDSYLKSRKSHFKVIITQFGMLVGFKALVAAGLLLIGGVLVFNQQMNIGQFVAAEIVIILIMNAVEKMIFTIESIYDVLTSVEKIAAVTDIPLEEFVAGNQTPDFSSGIDIKIKHVNLKDENKNHDYLTDISLDIKSGDKICVSGLPNAGKSILLQLIAGWYDSYEGNILFNNVPMRNMQIKALRENIGDCMATEGIFQGSIEENVLLGIPGFTFKELLDKSSVTGLTDYAEEQSQGFNKLIFSGDRTLPKRVKQQILWTRGIVGDKKLIIWEDVFGTIEREAKLKFVEYLTRKENPQTVILISNDKEIVKRCERSIGMEKGSIVHDLPVNEALSSKWFQQFNTTTYA